MTEIQKNLVVMREGQPDPAWVREQRLERTEELLRGVGQSLVDHMQQAPKMIADGLVWLVTHENANDYSVRPPKFLER